MNSHLTENEVEKFVNEHTSRFTDFVLNIEVGVGESFKTMKFATNMFIPKSREILRHYHLTTDPVTQQTQLVPRNSAPLGLLCIDQAELKKNCRHYIRAMIDDPSYVSIFLGVYTY